MTVAEFLEKYSAYRTEDELEALAEAVKIQVFDVEGKEHAVLPMKFGDEWCLLLDITASLIKYLKLDRTEGEKK